MNLGRGTFDYIEFTEIKTAVGGNFALPFIMLLGVHDGVLIKFVVSFTEQKDKKMLLGLIKL